MLGYSIYDYLECILPTTTCFPATTTTTTSSQRSRSNHQQSSFFRVATWNGFLVIAIIFQIHFYLTYNRIAVRSWQQPPDSTSGTIQNTSVATSRTVSLFSQQQQQQQSTFPVVDFLSVGSLRRLDSMQSQKETFASHVSLRIFFNITELDDDEPDCSNELQAVDAYAIADFCRGPTNRGGGGAQTVPLRSFMAGIYARREWLAKKASPTGWLCAQKRPVFGFIKVLRQYQKQQQEQQPHQKQAQSSESALPDYLLVGDDDTYYDLEAFGTNFPANGSSAPIVTAGCVVRQPIHLMNLTFPFGGFGTIFSRGSLKVALEPISCPRDTGPCEQIAKNWMGEMNVWQEGDSRLDIMEKMVRRARFVEYKNWHKERHYCWHSDWFLAYFTNWYNLSKHDDNDAYFANVPQYRLHSYGQDSVIYADAKGRCRNSNPDGSNLELDVAHYVNTTVMHLLNDRARQQNPQHWKPTLMN